MFAAFPPAAESLDDLMLERIEIPGELLCGRGVFGDELHGLAVRLSTAAGICTGAGVGP